MSSLSVSAYPPLFEQERPRLLSALGSIISGGVVESIQPIGSSCVPGMAGSGQVDIGLSIWPFPVDESALVRIGYQLVAGADPEAFPRGVLRFENDGGQVQLWVASAENDFLQNAVLIRDYLRGSEPARQDFMANRACKDDFFARILPDARQWWVDRHGFGPLETIAAEFMGPGDLQAARFPWYVASGWALDLFLGRVTRVHRDVDIVVPFSQQMALQEHLLERGWALITPLEGRLEPWPRHMQLQLPRHQIHAHRGGAMIDVLLTEIDQGVWHYRRSPVIIRSEERIGLKSPGGIPYLAPELVLLFKSRNTGRVERPQDQADFDQALPLLEPERRAWLRWALIAEDPQHEWLKVI